MESLEDARSAPLLKAILSDSEIRRAVLRKTFGTFVTVYGNKKIERKKEMAEDNQPDVQRSVRN